MQFTSEGSTGQSLTFAWDFNNDGQPDSDQPAPTFTFPQAGDFPVTLTVTDANGTSDSLTQTVSVSCPPAAGGRAVRLHPAAAGGQPERAVHLRGVHRTEPDVRVGLQQRRAAGQRPARADVHLPAGRRLPRYPDGHRRQRHERQPDADGLRCRPAPPVSAQFAFTPQQPEANQSVQFTSEGSTGQSLTFAWDFNNDGQPDSDQPAPTFTFPQAGDFPVTLTVTDANGTSDSLTQTISVTAAPQPEPEPIPSIAFVGQAGGSRQLFTMAADGTGVTQLTQAGGTVGQASWGPNGQIVFSFNQQLHTVTVDNPQPQPIGSVNGEQPTWSPDGSQIAFVRWNQDRTESDVYIVNADGSASGS